MNNTRSRTVAAAGFAALALVLSACSGGGDAEKGSKDAEPELGPLDKYFEQMYGDFDEDQANAQQMEVEELIAQCMRDLGFEYTPVDWSSMGGSYSSDDLDVEWGTLEFAEQYGYGATTDPWGDQGVEDEASGASQDEFVDPNQAYVEAMSETEMTAYYAALYGEQPEFDENADPEAEIDMEYNWEQAGCQGKASHEVYEVGTGMDDERFTALQDEMNTMWEATSTDPRITELNGTWSTCMADAGFPGLAAVGDAENSIYDQVNAIYDAAYSNVDPNVEMTEEDYKAIDDGVQDDLAAITPVEIKTAVADFTCREKIGYDEVQQKVNFELQQEFVDTHKEDLDAWLAAYKDAQG